MLISKDPSAITSLLKTTPAAVVAYPTETFYGLGALISDENAVNRIVEIKGRDATKGMIILASSMDMVRSLCHLDEKREMLLETFWPGPLSAVLPADENLSPLLAPGNRIAVRISPHPLALKLVEEVGPVTSTSANISGKSPAQCVDDILSQGLDLDGILDGGTTSGANPSTLIDLICWPPACLREGATPFQRILDISSRITPPDFRLTD